MKHINHAYLLAIGVPPNQIPAALQTLPKEVITYWTKIPPKWFQHPKIIEQLKDPGVILGLTGAIKHLIYHDLKKHTPAKLTLATYNTLLQKSYQHATQSES